MTQLAIDTTKIIIVSWIYDLFPSSCRDGVAKERDFFFLFCRLDVFGGTRSCRVESSTGLDEDEKQSR